MLLNSLLAFVAALIGVSLAVAAFRRERRSLSTWCFAAGMGLLAAESALGGVSLRVTLPDRITYWQTLALVVESFVPFVWLAFSLIYSRGNYGAFLRKWRVPLVLAFLLPVCLSITFFDELLVLVAPAEPGQGLWVALKEAGKVLNIFLLIGAVLVLMNLEKTFRAAVGTMQWRIKFMVLGLGVVFGARIYTRSHALLFSGHSLSFTGIEAFALLIGCMLMAVAYVRNGFEGIDVYPSRAVLQSSVTVVLVGVYLFVVGVFAQIVAHFGRADGFQMEALLVLLAMVVLAVLLLSEKLRLRIQLLVTRHFKRPEHDAYRVWSKLTSALANERNPGDLCGASAKLISETFNALSVTLWYADEGDERVVVGASTSPLQRVAHDATSSVRTSFEGGGLAGLQAHFRPFDLDDVAEGWAEEFRKLSPEQFQRGGKRICVPLRAGDRWLGAAVLADRVNGIPYSPEEMDLLKCIGDQVGAALQNLRLSEELMRSKELEAFQTMSTFFVHDLKNAASGLNLMLQNLPVHFDDPEFRADALRGVASTVNRINNLVSRLSALRNRLELKFGECDLNAMVNEVLGTLSGMPDVEVVKELHPLPKVVADREQLESVVTNLLLNARDAIGRTGRIRVETAQRDGKAILSVGDNGCGMSPAFLRDSLFRPFHTTKKKGLGIGMFQSKKIVEAHRGTLHAESEEGVGSIFRVTLPISANHTS